MLVCLAFATLGALENMQEEIIALVPLWMALVDRVLLRHQVGWVTTFGLVLGFGGALVIDGDLTVGTLFTFTSVTARVGRAGRVCGLRRRGRGSRGRCTSRAWECGQSYRHRFGWIPGRPVG